MKPQRCTKPSSQSHLSASHVASGRAERRSTQQKTLATAGVNLMPAFVRAPEASTAVFNMVRKLKHSGHAGVQAYKVLCTCKDATKVACIRFVKKCMQYLESHSLPARVS